MLIANWRINKLLLPQNIYSGAKHVPLFHCSYWLHFQSDQTNTQFNSLRLIFFGEQCLIVGTDKEGDLMQFNSEREILYEV